MSFFRLLRQKASAMPASPAFFSLYSRKNPMHLSKVICEQFLTDSIQQKSQTKKETNQGKIETRRINHDNPQANQRIRGYNTYYAHLLQVTPAPASRCIRALFARKPELNGVNTLEECAACSESALESPNATFLVPPWSGCDQKRTLASFRQQKQKMWT